MVELNDIIAQQKERLFFYSPYNFLRNLGKEKNIQFIERKITSWLKNDDNYFIFETQAGNSSFYFLYQYLSWDSKYFNYPTYKLFAILYSEENYNLLSKSVMDFKVHLAAKGSCYCFIDIPAEDTQSIQALTENGFRLTETRLTYYLDQVCSFSYPRFSVRNANETDILTLRRVASQACNVYDRYHADIFFTQQQADNYLETYAEACVKGLCETVLVPDVSELPTEAFLAISHLQDDALFFNTSMTRVVLTAVGPSCKGWHVKLVAETVQYAKERGSQYVLMTTQATNRAVFRTSEKLGFKLGNTTHILATTL